MQTANQNISKIFFFRCGSCSNHLNYVFKNSVAKQETTVFPALVCCICHTEKGVILFDTGYSDLIYKNGLLSRIYNWLNPAVVKSDDVITKKLEQYQISVEEVSHVLLSHAHPDHMGGFCFLPNKKVLMSREVLDTIKKSRLRSLVFQNMKMSLPSEIQVFDKAIHHPLLSRYFPKVYDVLGDGSLFATRLDGHAKGQMGLYIEERRLFLAADSAWGTELLSCADQMRPLARLIQENYGEYLETSRQITAFMRENTDISVVFSHTDLVEGEFES